MTLQELVEDVVGRMGGRIVERDADRFVVERETGEGRTQRVSIERAGETIRYATRCADPRDAFEENPSFYRTLLEKNYELRHGYFALAPDGGVEIVDSQLLETCDPEELCVSLMNLAALGDYVERQLSTFQEDRF